MLGLARRKKLRPLILAEWPAGDIIDVAAPHRIVPDKGTVSPIAFAEPIIDEGNIRNCRAVELPVGIDRIAAADEPVVVDLNVGNRTEVVVDHHSGRLPMRIDDGVMGDGYVRNTAVDLNAIVVRFPRGPQIVDVVVPDRRAAIERDAVFDIEDIVSKKSAGTVNAV